MLVLFLRKIIGKQKSTDDELLKKFQETNDLLVLEELYDRYIHLVFGVCMKYLQNEEDAKDATMQIFEKLVKDLPNQQVIQFDKWLYVVAKNYCLMILRKVRPVFVSNENISTHFMENQSDGHPLEENHWDDKIKHLDGAVNNLPEEQKICVTMFYLENKCYKEISENTGYDLNKVKSYIQNGKRNLRIILDKQSEA